MEDMHYRQTSAVNDLGKASQSLAIGLCLIVVQLHAFAAEPARTVASCTDQQLLAFAPRNDEAKSHRRFDLPKITYPFGAQPPSRDSWGFELSIRVDELGRVECYSTSDPFGKPLDLNDARRALLAGLSRWSYSPFTRNGTAVPVIATEYLYEEELPGQHRAAPIVPLENVRMSLERSGCFGTCPAYTVELFGDGTAVYKGGGSVDVPGKHRYRIDPKEVAKLVESARSKDLWSLRSEYAADITDHPSYQVTITLGDEVHRISDYVGQRVGMPEAVTEFEKEIDTVAQSNAWIHLSQQAVDHLRENHFSFSSRESGEMLLRAIADEDATDDQAMVDLIRLGAPWWIRSSSDHSFQRPPGRALEEALVNQRDAVVDLLIERGALREGHAVDRRKLDAAFRAAIRGGRLEFVQRIWDAGGSMHPSLTYVDIWNDASQVRKRAPVTLLLSRERYHARPWAGLEITKWLTAKGCDIHAHGADGRTLLHIAAHAGDINMVRYVLDQGVSATTPGAYSLPALGSTDDEDIALMLLQAGTNLSKMDDGGTEFRRYAIYNHWGRVIAWLDAQKSAAP